VLGTFLPWLSSGGVGRDSYAIAGIADRLGIAGGGFGSLLIRSVPLVGPIATLALVGAIARKWVVAAFIATLLGLIVGVAAVGASIYIQGLDVDAIVLALSGPVVTLMGAVLSLWGGVALLIRSARANKSYAGS